MAHRDSTTIRRQFLDFFRSKGHVIVPSAPIVVKDDPTLLFTNAGMNQFKEYFLGTRTAEMSRVADTQKCLRVSGKHNDLEEVGVDTYHHTMFEMLGNWSFGNPEKPGESYFKKEAIAWCWELLTGVYELDKSRLYVTVFGGDSKEGLEADDEARREWLNFVDASRILDGSKKDNFWEMGDTGPCGPCSEVHVDCRSDEERQSVDGASLVNKDHPQVIEIWNLVFIQFNRRKDGSLEQLPARHVDTGMGFERLTRVLQGKTSNYDTDVFSGTIAATESITGLTYDRSDSKQAVAFRVIADHVRAVGFAISDGQLPSNTGAGYVIRRILRRAVRYYYSWLDFKQPLLYRLIPVISKQFSEVFPELTQQEEFVSRVVREEEEAFLRTLDKGIQLFEERAAGSGPGETLPGDFAFLLNDTYGFPLDLTILMASERGLRVDEAGFGAAMKKQKDRSRSATAVDTGDWHILREGAGNVFTGYDSLEEKTRVLRYRKAAAKGKEAYQVVLESTPFYAESGGQVGDHGVLKLGGETLHVSNTRRENDLILHFTDKLPADLSAMEGEVFASVSAPERGNAARHHTATHLLHAALKSVLGSHVAQKGSLVNARYLRFDFSHFSKMNPEEIRRVEKLVNEKIRENVPVETAVLPKEEAFARGATGLFGEKYGDIVRMVTMDPAWSIELCGGTHAPRTGSLGSFVIVQETAVAAGVRRIEAMAGEPAEQYLDARRDEIAALTEVLRRPADLVKAAEQLVTDNASISRKLEGLEAKRQQETAARLAGSFELINGISFLGSEAEDANADQLKKLAFSLRPTGTDNYVIVLASISGGKPFVAVLVSDTLAAAGRANAGNLIKTTVAPLIRGGGGGQPGIATAGGQDASGIGQVVPAIRKVLGSL